MLGKSNKPRWAYDFDCNECENLQPVVDPEKKRNGIYCIPMIEMEDNRPAGWTPFNPDGSLKPSDGPIHADEHDRHIRCDCYKKKEGCQLCLWD